ncbi:YqaA family protein [Methylopila sp. Yamaguchi]|uniref:YqaA family protein n=1 Tax=Methylopila sp. Yamaguchi TaxID=1437817 RepID=UPI000CA6F961|nr:YqaA family protein [Methylopila sp. Yamaguchi]GBD47366.1 hypothetical protein METY_0579 [Methylopila sp. Yamaguchi]
MSGAASYGGLFVAAFLAATLLPAQSEAALVGLIALGERSPLALVTTASLGNTLGSLVNWAIGRQAERFRGRLWFPASDRALERAKRWYGRYGRWSLLLSWVPIIGDPLTLVAGVLREPLWSFLALVALAKTARYAALAAGTLALG